MNTNTKNAFTLIEVLLAVVLLGVAVAALVASNNFLTQANSAAANISTAEFLIEQLRELTAPLATIDPETGTAAFGAEEALLADYDDIDDFSASTFSPPIDAGRNTLNNFSAFTQQFTVENVSASNFQLLVPNHSSNFVRITVEVLYNSKPISSTTWIRARY